MIVIGITGTLGAGKGTVVEYLKEKGFAHFSAREFITKEIEKRGMPINRDTMTEVSNDLRAKNSPSYIVQELYREAEASGKNAVIESIRTVGEIDNLKAKGDFYLLAVDADKKTRYERVVERKSATDQISYEEFVEHEKREYESQDPNKQNLSACIGKADFVLWNDSTIDKLYEGVDDILKKINVM